MAALKPYRLDQAQALIGTAKQRYSDLNERRRVERQVLTTGSLKAFSDAEDIDEDTSAAILRKLVKVNPNRINLLLPAITLIHASIIPPVIEHNVEAREGGEHGDNIATIAGAKLDDIWYRAGKDVVERCAWDYVSIGETVAKVAYLYDERERETTEAEREDHFGSLVDAATDVAVAHGGKPTDLVGASDLENQVELTTTEVHAEGVTITYVDPCDFFIDEHATSLKDARWVAVRSVLPYREVLANRLYSKAAKVLPDGELGGGELMPRSRTAFNDPNSAEADDPTLTCTVWEFYDCVSRRLIVCQEGTEKALLNEPWPYEYNGVPFAHKVMYREKPSDFHGFGEVRNQAPLQLLHDTGLGMQVANAKKANAHKYLLADEDVDLSAEAADAMQSTVPGEVVRINTNGRSIQEVLMPFQPNPLPADVYQMITTAEEGIQKGLGLSDFQTGGGLTSHVSGTAAAMADGTATTRLTVKTSNLEEFIADLSRIALCFSREFEFADDWAAEADGAGPDELPGRDLHIRTPKGGKSARIYGWMLEGDFDIKVTSVSQAKNAAARKQDGLDLVTTMVPTLKNLDPSFDAGPLLRHALTLMALDPDVYYKQVPQAPAPAGPLDPAAGAAGAVPADPNAGVPMPDSSVLPDLGPQTTVGGPAADAQLDGGLAL